MQLSVFHIQGTSNWTFFDLIRYVNVVFHRRENTVLRGQLFERTDEYPSTLSVARNVYVIPNALVADQFRPSPVYGSSDTSKCFPSKNSWLRLICRFSSHNCSYLAPGVSQRDRSPGGRRTTHL